MARTRRSGFAKTIDFKKWVDLDGGRTALTAGGLAAHGSALAFTEPQTILRMRGNLVLQLDPSVSVDGDAAIITTGIALVSTDAAVLGITALPDPHSDPGYPWIWWNSTPFNVEDATFSLDNTKLIEIDSKAMRKAKPSESLVVVYEHTDVSGALAVTATLGHIRILVGQ